MSPLDLVRSSADGSMSLTKLAAATAHLLMAIAFFRQQVLSINFNESLWLAYGGFAIGHAAWDKTSTMVKDFKDRKLEAASPAPTTETTIVQTTKE